MVNGEDGGMMVRVLKAVAVVYRKGPDRAIILNQVMMEIHVEESELSKGLATPALVPVRM